MTDHNNNWAVLVCTSTFWFNYRHVANVLSVYHIIKRLGIPDDHIIMMLGDDMACNPRNSLPATVYNHYDHHLNVYDEQVEVDYRDRLPIETPKSKRLASDESSNVLIYLTGHGGDNFLKFQDTEEINAHDLADAIHQMNERRRYNQVLLMIDTCQASTMHEHLQAPRVTAIASSIKGESSYSYHVDEMLGVAVLDRFTWALLEFTRNMVEAGGGNATLADLYSSLDPDFLQSHPHLLQTEGALPLDQVQVRDFMGSVRPFKLGAPLIIDSDLRSVNREMTSGDRPRFRLSKRDLNPLRFSSLPLLPKLLPFVREARSMNQDIFTGIILLGLFIGLTLALLTRLFRETRPSNKEKLQ